MQSQKRLGPAITVFLGAIVIATGWWGWHVIRTNYNEIGIPEAGSARGYNLLFVTFDTTRPDHLGSYGYSSAHTPTIDGLSRQGVTFDQSVVAVPLTLPSHTTMMTGQNPFRHGVRTNTGYEVKSETNTLAERLKANGYSTAAFVSCFVLDARFGLNQGFDTYDFAVSEKGQAGPESVFSQRDAKMVTNSAINWLRGNRKSQPKSPFFAWVHYYDPHHPFASPLASRPEFAGRPYDAEIAYADQELGRLISELDDMNLRDQTLIVFATDHGESLGEHGESGHGIFVYDATIRGAIVFSCASLFSGEVRVTNRLAATIDIAPTLLSLLGVPPLPDVDGLDLTSQPIESNRMVVIESMYPKEGRGCAPYFGIRTLDAKYIDAPKAEFYLLGSDPTELNNLFAQSPLSMLPLEKELKDLAAAFPSLKGGNGAIRTMTTAETAQLESLGYTGGITITETDQLPDAKDRIALFEQVDTAIEMVKSGQVDEGLALAKELMSKTEGFETPVHTVAHIFEGLGRRSEAVELLEEYAKRYPSANMFLHLAKNHAALDQWDDFERALQAAAIIEPRRGSIPLLRGDRFMEVGRYTEAVKEYELAISLDPFRIGPVEREKLTRARKLAGLPDPPSP